MKNFRTITIALLSLGVLAGFTNGCAMFNTGTEDFDVLTSDVAIGQDTIGFLDEATVLTDTGWHMDTSVIWDIVIPPDTTTPIDTGVQDEGAVDIASADTFEPDSELADIVDSDESLHEDVSGDIPTETGIRIPCSVKTECPADFDCVSTARTGSYCQPPQICSTDGLTSIKDLLSGLLLVNDQVPIFIKLSVQVEMGQRTCSPKECDSSNKCCRDCFASIRIEDLAEPVVLIRGKENNPVGCSGFESNDGSDCGELECRPLIPGTQYILWGSLRKMNPWELQLEGSCPESEALDAVD